MLLFLDQAVDIHADWVERECNRRQVPFYRFCTEQFPHQVSLTVHLDGDGLEGVLRAPDREISLREVTGIWHRRPGELTPHPEMDPLYEQFAVMEASAVLGGLCRALWDRRWVSPPHRIWAANHKLHQLRLARRLGFQTAPTLVTSDPAEVALFYQQCDEQMIFKTLRQNAVAYDDEADIALGIYTTRIGEEELDVHLDAVRFVPCLFQRWIPKQYELRINVIGQRVWTTAIHSQELEEARVDFRPFTDDCRHEPALLPPAIECLCLKMTRALGLRMSSIDMIVTPDNEYVFLELNPSAQWAWIEEQVGFPLCTALVDELLGVDTLAEHPYIKARSLRFEPSAMCRLHDLLAA